MEAQIGQKWIINSLLHFGEILLFVIFRVLHDNVHRELNVSSVPPASASSFAFLCLAICITDWTENPS